MKLSKTQLRVLDSIQVGEKVTAQRIAERYNLSSSWASTLLKRLYDKSYLKRTGSGQKSRGIEFNYTK